MFLQSEVLKYTCITFLSTGTKRKRKTRSWACQRNGWRWWWFPLNPKFLLSVTVCNSCNSCSMDIKNVCFNVVLVFLLSYSFYLGVLYPHPSELWMTFYVLGQPHFQGWVWMFSGTTHWWIVTVAEIEFIVHIKFI